MSKIENNSTADYTWEDFKKEHYTPEEISASKVRASIICALADVRNEGKITVKELEELEEICDAELERNDGENIWIDRVLEVLLSNGKTLAVVPLEQNNAN